MKRELRPFVVEVRRGSKKSAAPFLPPPPDSIVETSPMQRAEELIFSVREPEPAGAPAKTGRILESLADREPEPEPEALLAEEPAPRRRGRPPGSKNRPRPDPDSDAPDEPRRRGRPRSGPAARTLALTPDLVEAAMQSMARVATARAADSPSLEPSAEDAMAESVAKRHESPAEEDVRDARGEAERLLRAALMARLQANPAALWEASANGAGRASFLRQFEPGQRWRGRARMRAVSRRQRKRASTPG